MTRTDNLLFFILLAVLCCYVIYCSFYIGKGKGYHEGYIDGINKGMATCDRHK